MHDKSGFGMKLIDENTKGQLVLEDVIVLFGVLNFWLPYLFLLGYTKPDLNTCRVAVIDSQGGNTNSTNQGAKTHCESQRDEGIRTQPTRLYFAIKADFTKYTGSLVPHVSESQVGIVGANITAVKVSLAGQSVCFCSVPVHFFRIG